MTNGYEGLGAWNICIYCGSTFYDNYHTCSGYGSTTYTQPPCEKPIYCDQCGKKLEEHKCN